MENLITDRLPTEEDADCDGDIEMARRPGSNATCFVHWSHVKKGVPWKHTKLWKPPAKLPGLKGQWIKASDFMPTMKYADECMHVQLYQPEEYASCVDVDNFNYVEEHHIWRPLTRKDDRPLFDNK